jgi:hypothetical protein
VVKVQTWLRARVLPSGSAAAVVIVPTYASERSSRLLGTNIAVPFT